MISRRRFTALSMAAAVGTGIGGWSAEAAERLAPAQLEGGGLTQAWFLESFLEFNDDLAEATAKGKRFAILWEQDGCPYCRETHMVNFAIPEIRAYIQANFEIVQLDIWGGRATKDFDGETLTEKQLAKRSRVRFTPTIQFFPPSTDAAAGKIGANAEVVRMPGYFRPFHFLSMFEFVREEAYAREDFRSFLNKKTAAIKAAGKSIPSW